MEADPADILTDVTNSYAFHEWLKQNHATEVDCWVDSGTPFSPHHSLIVIPVVNRHRSTCSRRIDLMSFDAIAASPLVVCDDCGTYWRGTEDAVVLTLTVKFHSDPEQDQYEQIGNAIPPLLAFALVREIVKRLS